MASDSDGEVEEGFESGRRRLGPRVRDDDEEREERRIRYVHTSGANGWACADVVPRETKLTVRFSRGYNYSGPAIP